MAISRLHALFSSSGSAWSFLNNTSWEWQIHCPVSNFPDYVPKNGPLPGCQTDSALLEEFVRLTTPVPHPCFREISKQHSRSPTGDPRGSLGGVLHIPGPTASTERQGAPTCRRVSVLDNASGLQLGWVTKRPERFRGGPRPTNINMYTVEEQAGSCPSSFRKFVTQYSK